MDTKIFKAIKESSNGSLKTILALLVGVGIAWGTLKSQVNDLRADADEQTTYIRQIDQRLSRIEGRLGLEPTPFKFPLSPLGIQNKQ